MSKNEWRFSISFGNGPCVVSNGCFYSFFAVIVIRGFLCPSSNRISCGSLFFLVTQERPLSLGRTQTL